MSVRRAGVFIAVAATAAAACTGSAAAAAPVLDAGTLLSSQISDSAVAHPATAVSASGDTTIAWQRHLAAGGWSLEFAQSDPHGVQDDTVTGAGAVSQSDIDPGSPAIAADRMGGSVILQRYVESGVWRVALVRVFADGSHRVWAGISAAGKNSTDPVVSVGPTGSGVAAWLTDETDTGGWVLHWVPFSSAGKPGAIQSANPVKVVAKKATVPVIAELPAISATPAGVATLAYRSHDSAKSKFSIVAIRISSAGKATKTVTVAPAADTYIKDLASASSANGSTLVAWSAGITGGYVIRGSLVDGSGKVKPVVSAGTVGNDSKHASVAISPSGQGAIAWEEASAEGNVISAVRVSATGVQGPTKAVRPASADLVDVRPVVSMGADGSALVGWVSYETVPDPDPSIPTTVTYALPNFVRFSLRSSVTPAAWIWTPATPTVEADVSLAANAAGGASVGVGLSRADGSSDIARFTVAP